MDQEIDVTLVRQISDDQPGERVTYSVPFQKGMTVLMALEYLYQKHGVAYRHSCDIGLCTICVMRVNGKAQMVCKIILHEPRELVIEPPGNHPILRDLVGDFDRKRKLHSN